MIKKLASSKAEVRDSPLWMKYIVSLMISGTIIQKYRQVVFQESCVIWSFEVWWKYIMPQYTVTNNVGTNFDGDLLLMVCCNNFIRILDCQRMLTVN